MERIERFFFKKIDEIIDDKFVRKIKIPNVKTREGKKSIEIHQDVQFQYIAFRSLDLI